MNVLSESPSPHMLDFWDAVDAMRDVTLKLYFKHSQNRNKPWGKIQGGLDITVLDWSEQSISRKFKALNSLASSPADVWIFTGGFWRWESHYLVTALRNHHSKNAILLEPICPGFLRLLGEYSFLHPMWAPFKKRAARSLVRRFDAVAAMGSWGSEQWRSLLPEMSVFQTAYYIDLTSLMDLPLKNEKADDTVNLAYCGSFVSRKNVGSLIKCLRLIENYKNWRLLIAGDGPSRRALETSVPRCFSDQVQFLGALDQVQMREFWKAVDVLVLPSLYDGWGMVVLESLASGVPVLSSPSVGAARDYVRNGENGWIREVNAEFFRPIIDLLERPCSLSSLSWNARESVKMHTPERGAMRFVDDLRKLLGEPAGTEKMRGSHFRVNGRRT